MDMLTIQQQGDSDPFGWFRFAGMILLPVHAIPVLWFFWKKQNIRYRVDKDFPMNVKSTPEIVVVSGKKSSVSLLHRHRHRITQCSHGKSPIVFSRASSLSHL
jgi:hypothetical protein